MVLAASFSCVGVHTAVRVFVTAQVDSPLSEQNLPWREKVLVTGPDVMFEVSQPRPFPGVRFVGFGRLERPPPPWKRACW